MKGKLMTGEAQRLERLERVDLFALQQVADGMRETNTNLRNLTAEVTNMGRDVSVLVAQNLKGELDALEHRIATLEAASQQSRGTKDFFDWTLQQLPWIVGFLALLASIFIHKEKS